MSDHGTQFLSKLWVQFLESSNIKPVYCSIRHPQSNVAERTMRCLGKFLRGYCSERHTAWARYLPQIEKYINFTTHTVTEYSPYELHYGVKPVDKIREIIKFPPEVDEPYEVKVELANARTKKQHERHKRNQRNFSEIALNLNDLVLVRIPRQSDALNKCIAKFFHIYYGPYRISRIFNRNAYELADCKNPEKIIGKYNRIDLRLYKQLPSDAVTLVNSDK